MNLMGSKVLSIGALIVHALTIFLFVVREAIGLSEHTAFRVLLFVLLALGLTLTGVLIYRFVRSLWHTHCSIREYFGRQRPYASQRMLLLLKREPYKLLHSRISVNYGDCAGKKVFITKHQEVEVLAEQLDHLWDRGILADQKVDGARVDENSFWTSLGKISKIDNDGSGYSVRTELPQTYKKGDRFGREFKYTLINSYCSKDENFVLTAGKVADRITIAVTVPAPAHLYNPTVEYAVANLRIPFQDQAPVDLSGDNQSLTWSINEPTFGERFILHWTVGNNGTLPAQQHQPAQQSTKKDRRKAKKALKLNKGAEQTLTVSTTLEETTSLGEKDKS